MELMVLNVSKIFVKEYVKNEKIVTITLTIL